GRGRGPGPFSGEEAVSRVSTEPTPITFPQRSRTSNPWGSRSSTPTGETRTMVPRAAFTALDSGIEISASELTAPTATPPVTPRPGASVSNRIEPRSSITTKNSPRSGSSFRTKGAKEEPGGRSTVVSGSSAGGNGRVSVDAGGGRPGSCGGWG